MKCTLVLALALFAVVYSKETYSTENDNFDIDSVINNPAKFEPFVGCFTDEASCDDTMNHFKNDLGEAIQQACAKCTDPQKLILHKFITALKKKMPDSYTTLKAKFDPGNKYFGPLEAAVAP